MTETEWTCDCCRDAETLGAMTYPLSAQIRTPAGWPDRVYIHRGRTFWVEHKGPKTPVEPLQREILRKLWHRTPGHVWIARRNADDHGGFIIGPAETSGEGIQLVFRTRLNLLATLEEARKLAELRKVMQ